MKRQTAKSNIIVIAVSTIIVGILAFGVYMLSSLDVFDTSGGYIKDMANGKDVISFMENAESISYASIINGENALDEFKDKPIKYWGYIENKEVYNDGTAVYNMTVILNKKDTNKVGNTLNKNSDGLALAPVTFRTSKSYNNFVIGDSVFMYGTLTEINENDKGERIPHFEAVKVVLDTEE